VSIVRSLSTMIFALLLVKKRLKWLKFGLKSTISTFAGGLLLEIFVCICSLNDT
jgi:hypothetical protein